MLRAVRLSLRQQMPNYRKPASFLIKETFPLPPYSGVIGMVHAACEWENGYHPMRVSIQGDYASTVSDYAKSYAFGISYDPGRHQAKVEAEPGKYDGINIGTKSYELLTDVTIILHIVPEEDAQVDKIAEALYAPPVYLSLGRHEDLIQPEALDIVVLERSEESRPTEHDIYIPVKDIDPFCANLIGTVYRINKVFEIDRTSKKKPMRFWKETVTVRHVCKGSNVKSDAMYIDKSFGDLVFLA